MPAPLGQSSKAADEGLPQLEDVKLDEKPLADVPMDTPFRDETGAPVTLGDVVGDTPVILSFNYSDCPMLCSVQLGGLVDVLNKMDTSAGDDFDIVTIALDPKETHSKAMETKLSYLERYRRPNADAGWRFLTGDKASIDAVASAVGFGYHYEPKTKEYLHPAVLTLLSAKGQVAGYVHGVSFEAEDLEKSLQIAADGTYQKPVQQFLLSCYRYIKETGFARTGMQVMRLGGLFFVIGALGFVGFSRYRANRLASHDDHSLGEDS